MSPMHFEERENELQIGAPPLVCNHLDFIDYDGPNLVQNVGMCKCDGSEFFVCQQSDVVLSAHKWSDIVSLTRCLDRAYTKRRIYSPKMPELVRDQCL